MKKALLILLVSSLFTGLFTGCASYRATVLTPLQPETTHYSASKEDIRLDCKRLSAEDTKKYLDRDLLNEGIIPIQITIRNHSKHPLLFSKNNISLPTYDPEYVAKLMHTSTLMRTTTYGVGAFFFSPLFAIPAIVDGVKSSNANDLLDEDFSKKSAFEQTIAPHSTSNGLIFVPIDMYQETFSIQLVNLSTNETIVFSPKLI